jgi:hypothetical protein
LYFFNSFCSDVFVVCFRSTPMADPSFPFVTSRGVIGHFVPMPRVVAIQPIGELRTDNGFSVAVAMKDAKMICEPGNGDNKVLMPVHGPEAVFAFDVSNNTGGRAECTIWCEEVKMGHFLLKPWTSTSIDRPGDTEKNFTFMLDNESVAVSAGAIPGHKLNGRWTFRFTPEKHKELPAGWPRGGGGFGFVSGGGSSSGWGAPTPAPSSQSWGVATPAGYFVPANDGGFKSHSRAPESDPGGPAVPQSTGFSFGATLGATPAASSPSPAADKAGTTVLTGISTTRYGKASGIPPEDIDHPNLRTISFKMVYRAPVPSPDVAIAKMRSNPSAYPRPPSPPVTVNVKTHSHPLITRFVAPGLHFCDVCKQSIAETMTRSCIPCDYDICKVCFTAAVDPRPASGRAAAFMFHESSGRSMFEPSKPKLRPPASVKLTPASMNAMADEVDKLGSRTEGNAIKVLADFGVDASLTPAMLLYHCNTRVV